MQNQEQLFYRWECPQCKTDYRLPEQFTRMYDNKCCREWFYKTISWHKEILSLCDIIIQGGNALKSKQVKREGI